MNKAGRTPGGNASRVLVAIFFFAMVGVSIWAVRLRLAPPAPWRVEVRLLAKEGSGFRAWSGSEAVSPSDSLALEVVVPRPVFLYVLTEGDDGRLTLLHPRPAPKALNPILPGVPRRLPGTLEDPSATLALPPTAAPGQLLVVAALGPIAILERELRLVRPGHDATREIGLPCEGDLEGYVTAIRKLRPSAIPPASGHASSGNLAAMANPLGAAASTTGSVWLARVPIASHPN